MNNRPTPEIGGSQGFVSNGFPNVSRRQNKVQAPTNGFRFLAVGAVTEQNLAILLVVSTHGTTTREYQLTDCLFFN